MSTDNNTDRMYANMKDVAEGYSKRCICLCSKLLQKWHKSNNMNGFFGFDQCESLIFDDPMELVNPIQHNNEDYYHWIIMWIIQCSYSSLLAKFRLSNNPSVEKYFHGIHKGTIRLPTYVNTGANYTMFQISRYVRLV